MKYQSTTTLIGVGPILVVQNDRGDEAKPLRVTDATDLGTVVRTKDPTALLLVEEGRLALWHLDRLTLIVTIATGGGLVLLLMHSP